MAKTTRPRWRAAAGAAALSLLVAACGGEATEPRGEGAGRLTILLRLEPAGPLPAQGERLTVVLEGRDGTPVLEEEYPVHELATRPPEEGKTFPSGDLALADLRVPPGAYRLSGALATNGQGCTEPLRVTPDPALDAAFVVGSTCTIQVEERAPWLDAAGRPAADRVSEFWGASHCGWQDVRFLALTRDGETATYARDPRGTFPRESYLSGAALRAAGLDPGRPQLPDDLRRAVRKGAGTLVLDLDADLPPDAQPTGYRRGVREIWTSPSDGGDYVYVVGPEGAERWPRIRIQPLCE